MNNSLLILILLGLAAALMPWQFAYEIFLFGKERGQRKAAAFVGGITLFRVVVLSGVGLIFVGLTAFVTEKIVDIAQFARSFLGLLGHEVTSGQRVVLDLLLIMSGALLLFEAYAHFRRVRTGKPAKDIADTEQQERSGGSLILLGLGWMVISINQWLFTLAAANQILVIANDAMGRLLLALLFLLLSSLLILLPFVIYLLKPESTKAILERLNSLINSSLGYLIVALMIAAGLYFVWIGVQGLLNTFR